MTEQRLQDKPDSARIKSQQKGGSGTTPKIPRKITPTYLHNAGLYYLQRYASSSGQFRRAMQRKIDRSCMAHPEQNLEDCRKILDTLIETFQRSGLLNDELYTTGAIRSLRRRGLSARSIMAKMAIKGVPAPLVKKVLEEIDSMAPGDPNLVAAVRHARRRRIGPFRSPDKIVDEKANNRHMSAMARAGYDFETARRVLAMELAEAEDLIVLSAP